MSAFRPIPFYFINTADPAELTPAACRAAMRELAEAGYGGCVLFNKPPAGFDEQRYLSDFWFETLENFIIAGREFKLELWLNDGFDYPPGDAAGRILARNPALGQQRLRRNAAGHAEVAAVPWGFPAFELPESSELFIELVYEAHKKHLGQYFGNGFHGFFSDCDNRRINHFVLGALPGEPYFPWSENFSAAFRTRYGYAVEPHLDAILNGRAPQAQEDYWQLAGELYQQWFANNHAWCRANGLSYTFHTSDTGPLPLSACRRSSIFSEGDPFTLLAHSDCPGTDHEILLLDGGTHYDRRYRIPAALWGTGEKPRDSDFANTAFDLRAKYAASAAFMFRRKRVMCEMFAATNFSASFQDLRRIAAWQIMQGVNFIVPHAVHHRFHGSTKFFAPPEFLHGSLRTGLRQFNDDLAHWCEIASMGNLAAAVAVIAPTRALWRGESDGRRIFALCDRLNRSGAGYVIVTPEYVRHHRADFALIIDPEQWNGGPLPEGLPGGDIAFSGGELHYMRRILADGAEFLIAANIWSDRELSGILHYGGRDCEIALEPGEMAVLGGPCEQYRRPERRAQTLPLPETLPVEFEEANVIPLEYWERRDETHRLFRWRNLAALPELALDIPAGFVGEVRCDGVILAEFAPLRHWADDYCRCPLAASDAGWHELEFTGALSETESCFLRGEFDVKVATPGKAGRLIRETYNLALYAPERATIELAPRRKQLTAGPWAERGQMFYPGRAVCRWQCVCRETADVILTLPRVGGVCELLLDGEKAGTAIFAPYCFPLSLAAGRHELTLVFTASAGALLEGGAALSGMLEQGGLIGGDGRIEWEI